MDALDRVTQQFSGEDFSPKQQCNSPSILDTLKRRELSLKTQLADVTAAREALEANPEVAKVLELIARAR